MRFIVISFTVAFLAASADCADPPRGAPVEAKYVPATFCAAIAFEPARLDKAATAAGLPIGELWKNVEGFTGNDIKQFERVTLLIEPFPGGNVLFMPALVLRYPAGTDARKQLPDLLGGVTDAKVGNVTYARSKKYKMAKVEMAGYAIDDRTLLVAPWPTLEPMLAAGGKDKDRVLSAALAKTDFGHDVVLVITPAPVLKRLAEIEKESGKSTDSETFKELKSALEKVSAIILTLDLGADTLVRAEFQCGTEASAKMVHATLKDLLAKGKEAYTGARKGLELEFAGDAMKPVFALLDAAVNDHVLKTNGDMVVLTVARPKNPNPKK